MYILSRCGSQPKNLTKVVKRNWKIRKACCIGDEGRNEKISWNNGVFKQSISEIKDANLTSFLSSKSRKYAHSVQSAYENETTLLMH